MCIRKVQMITHYICLAAWCSKAGPWECHHRFGRFVAQWWWVQTLFPLIIQPIIGHLNQTTQPKSDIWKFH